MVLRISRGPPLLDNSPRATVLRFLLWYFPTVPALAAYNIVSVYSSYRAKSITNDPLLQVFLFYQSLTHRLLQPGRQFFSRKLAVSMGLFTGTLLLLSILAAISPAQGLLAYVGGCIAYSVVFSIIFLRAGDFSFSLNRLSIASFTGCVFRSGGASLVEQFG
jgi:hypothetical protein